MGCPHVDVGQVIVKWRSRGAFFVSLVVRGPEGKKACAREVEEGTTPEMGRGKGRGRQEFALRFLT